MVLIFATLFDQHKVLYNVCNFRKNDTLLYSKTTQKLLFIIFYVMI